MDDNTAIRSNIQLNLLAAAIFFVGLVLLAGLIVDLTRRPPGRGDASARSAIGAVGFRERAGGKSYDSFTVFEGDGSVFTYWREGETWKSRRLPAYK